MTGIKTFALERFEVQRSLATVDADTLVEAGFPATEKGAVQYAETQGGHELYWNYICEVPQTTYKVTEEGKQ